MRRRTGGEPRHPRGRRHGAPTPGDPELLIYSEEDPELLIYSEEAEPTGTPEEQAAEMQKWFVYTQEMQDAGVYVAGDPLQGTEMATTVRVRNDESLTTDGPFAETKEVLGGYYLIDVDHLDDAIKWAGKCPGAVYGSIEVRPLLEIEGM